MVIMTKLLALFFILLATPAVAQELQAHTRLKTEIWPTSVDSIQHRLDWEGNVALKWFGRIKGTGGMQLVWWGHHNSLIPGSFLNAETGAWLERNYHVGIAGRIGKCWIGPHYDRRSVVALGQKAIWGETLGYHDQVRVRGTCGGPRWAAQYQSPGFWRFNDITLSHVEHIADAWIYLDQMKITGHFEAGGVRETSGYGSLEYDAGNVAFGMSAGTLARPDWVTTSLLFVGFHVTLEFGHVSPLKN